MNISKRSEETKDYIDDNLLRCEKYKGHFLHKYTKQKEAFYDVKLSNIILLKYGGFLIV